MSFRFELSFKNKKVRIWFVIMVPVVLGSVLFMLFTEINYHSLVSLFPVMGWLIFYIWRYLYRRKQKKESPNT